MSRRPRRNRSPAFKAKSALSGIKGEKTLIQLAQEFDVHPNPIKQWRDQLLGGATGVFGDAPKAEPEPVFDMKALHAKIRAASSPRLTSSRRWLPARSRSARLS